MAFSRLFLKAKITEKFLCKSENLLIMGSINQIMLPVYGHRFLSARCVESTAQTIATPVEVSFCAFPSQAPSWGTWGHLPLRLEREKETVNSLEAARPAPRRGLHHKQSQEKTLHFFLVEAPEEKLHIYPVHSNRL